MSETDWGKRRAECQQNIQRRMAKLVGEIAGQDDTEMADAYMENSASAYTDPERFDLERRKIFQGQPVIAALSTEMPNPGDCIVFEDTGVSILVARNRNGEAKAYLNMCMHRGAKMKEESGNYARISCPFHAWTYNLDGQLVSLPGESGFDGMCKESKSLISVPCKEWAGCIFVIATPGDQEIDIKEFLGDFAPELEQLEIDKVIPVKAGTLEADANWKYALDTYGEGYHFARLHPETVSLMTVSNVNVFEPFDKHFRLTFPPHSVREWVKKPESEWPTKPFSAVHFIFPNTVIFYGSLSEGSVFLQMFRLFPGDDVGTLKTRFSVYAPGDLANEDGSLDDAQRDEITIMGFDATSHVVMTEDYWVAANGYKQLASAPADFKVLYGANEPAVQFMHKNLERALAE